MDNECLINNYKKKHYPFPSEISCLYTDFMKRKSHQRGIWWLWYLNNYVSSFI